MKVQLIKTPLIPVKIANYKRLTPLANGCEAM